MKKTTYTIGAVIILLFSAFVFIAVPVFSGGTKQETPVLGKYNGKEVRYEQGSDFNNIASNYYEYFKQQGYEINENDMSYIYSMAFNETVRTMAYLDFVEESNYTVPVSKVNRTMMQYFLDDRFDEKYLKAVLDVKSDEYYINMMIAWYFATALAKQKAAVLPYFENKSLPKWVHNKAISKAVESYRIDGETKAYLKTLKIK